MTEWDYSVDRLETTRAQPSKRGRGRPKGVRNKSKEMIESEDIVRLTYERIRPYLNNEMNEYIDAILDGRQEIDPINEMNIVMRQASVLLTNASVGYLNDQRVTQDLAKFVDAVRMCAKDLFDMKRRTVLDEEAKKKEEDGVVEQPVSRDTLERLAALIRDNPA